VTDHLFVFEGSGIVKDFKGTLSDYAECLFETESSSGEGDVVAEAKKGSYKEDKEARMKRTNDLKKDKKEMKNIDNKMEKLKKEISASEIKIEGSADEGWTVLGEFLHLRSMLVV
jgi:ATP-binding cassette subfamily F protein uup